MTEIQIPDLNDKQAVFDFTTRMIIKQGGPSMDGFGGCSYRGPNGRRCAVGWCIPDEKYDPLWEGRKVGALGVVPMRHNFFPELQSAHDNYLAAGDDDAPAWAAWQTRLREIAELHGLDPAVLSEIPVEEGE